MFISSNTTPFLAEAFCATTKTCEKLCVVVVRATYDVAASGECQVSQQQSPLVYADAHYGDPLTTSVRVESDFVPFKPSAEVLLDARAVSEGGREVESLEVALLGPGLNKHAIVTGERRWIRGVMGMTASRPVPFQTLALGWHLAYGGADRKPNSSTPAGCDVRNPVGRGYQETSSHRAIEGKLLPCIEHPRSRMTRWNDRIEPIGFGPVPRFASARAPHAGTYDQAWMDEILPFLPADFEDRYHLASPIDQRFDALVAGTELVCLNMSASGTFRVKLPAFSIPVGFMLDGQKRVAYVSPDTATLVPHESRLVLVGRTSLTLPRKFMRLRHIIVGAECELPTLRAAAST